jgi:hypothetical protein
MPVRRAAAPDPPRWMGAVSARWIEMNVARDRASRPILAADHAAIRAPTNAALLRSVPR